MQCIETIKNKKKDQIIEIHDLYPTEFKTKLKTYADVEKMINDYTTIYVYIAAKKEVLQILGNYTTTKTIKDDEGNEETKTIYTKKIIYNYQKKKHKEIDETHLVEIYSQLLEFCSLAEQLIMFKKIEEEDKEITALRNQISTRIDRNKIRKFLEE